MDPLQDQRSGGVSYRANYPDGTGPEITSLRTSSQPTDRRPSMPTSAAILTAEQPEGRRDDHPESRKLEGLRERAAHHRLHEEAGDFLQPGNSKDAGGWLGLNLATTDLPAVLRVNPVVGARHVPLETALTELAGWEPPVASVGRPLGHLTPSNMRRTRHRRPGGRADRGERVPAAARPSPQSGRASRVRGRPVPAGSGDRPGGSRRAQGAGQPVRGSSHHRASRRLCRAAGRGPSRAMAGSAARLPGTRPPGRRPDQPPGPPAGLRRAEAG